MFVCSYKKKNLLIHHFLYQFLSIYLFSSSLSIFYNRILHMISVRFLFTQEWKETSFWDYFFSPSSLFLHSFFICLGFVFIIFLPKLLYGVSFLIDWSGVLIIRIIDIFIRFKICWTEIDAQSTGLGILFLSLPYSLRIIKIIELQNDNNNMLL